MIAVSTNYRVVGTSRSSGRSETLAREFAQTAKRLRQSQGSRIKLFHILLILLAMMVAPAPSAHAQRQNGADFVDEFDTLSDARWFRSDGWTNGNWISNAWQARQISVHRGALLIRLDRRRVLGKPFTSGELQSRDRHSYGYYEVRMRAARGSGIVNAFFTYTREGDNQDTWDEIDIEILGRNTRQVEFTFFANGVRTGAVRDLGFDAADGMHTYAFEWLPERITWFVDGQPLHVFENMPMPQRPQRLYASLWNSYRLRDWVGPIDPRLTRANLLVDCIAFTQTRPAASPCDR